MRILFVAMPESIHAARWISQITDQGWEVYLFPAVRRHAHPAFRNITVFGAEPLRKSYVDKSVRYIRWISPAFYLDSLASRFRRRILNKLKAMALTRVIRRVRPDIIHSLELQHAGYLTLHAKKKFPDKFPAWIATNWGSDIFLFGKLPAHQPLIREVLQQCDYYSCECDRDISLARAMGFRGHVLPVLPNAGGINIEYATKFRRSGPVSGRKTIILKGYQGWAGRALVGLEAFRLCLPMLKDYTIVIYAASEETASAAQRLARETGIRVEIVPPSRHEEILSRFGQARIYVGLSISDGISTSLLEAMVLGAFPIQSCTACADEWIEDGISGSIVPPEDPLRIAEALRCALVDDALVDRAAEINARTVVKRLDYFTIQRQVIKMYNDIHVSRKD
jgi:glycosyltransferase involved in cell wall biosynthesis